MIGDQRVSHVQIRHELLGQLQRPGAQLNWAGFARSRGYDTDQVRAVCVRMRRSGELVNAHPADDGELASRVMRLWSRR